MSDADFDVGAELFRTGQLRAAFIALHAASRRGRASDLEIAEAALQAIGHEIAQALARPETPEAWLAGIHDIEALLRRGLADPAQP